MLTNKAKRDFYNWFVNKYQFKGKKFDELNIYQKGDVAQFLRFETTENAYMIEWLDSVRIYIDIAVTLRSSKIPYFQVYINTIEYYEKFDSRQEATVFAISKANEIYNNQK